MATVHRALNNLDPLVVIDFFLSETSELADVVLPGSVWCEDEGTTTNLEGRVIKITRAADPPGSARRDLWIVTESARHLGRGQFFSYQTTCDVWEELRVASKGGVADYYGITWEKIDAQDGVFWPCPSEDHPGTPRLYTERFGHPDGRARFVPIEYTAPAEEPGGEFPFRLTTRDQALPDRVCAAVHAVEPGATIILYGSRARGDAESDSDWDLLVLLDGDVTPGREALAQRAVYEVEWSHPNSSPRSWARSTTTRSRDGNAAITLTWRASAKHKYAPGSAKHGSSSLATPA